MKDIGPSEYEGRGTEQSSVFDKPASAMDNGERQALFYLTGQTTDATAPVDPALFRGAVSPQVENDNGDIQDFAT